MWLGFELSVVARVLFNKVCLAGLPKLFYETLSKIKTHNLFSFQTQSNALLFFFVLKPKEFRQNKKGHFHSQIIKLDHFLLSPKKLSKNAGEQEKNSAAVLLSFQFHHHFICNFCAS